MRNHADAIWGIPKQVWIWFAPFPRVPMQGFRPNL
jgi:hypothetical protein